MRLVVSRIPVDAPAPRAPLRSERACIRSQGRMPCRWGAANRGRNAPRSGYLGVRRPTAACRATRDAAEAGEGADGVGEVAVAAVWPVSPPHAPMRSPRVETDNDDVLTLL